MVRIIAGLLGKPKGKSGEYVYRIVNGKPFASLRPEKYNASQSEAAKDNRGKFGTTIKFAKYINSIPELSNIWKFAKTKGKTSFNKIVKYNIKSIEDCSFTTSNIITPNLSTHFANMKIISFDGVTIKFDISLNNNTKTPITNSPLLVFAVIALQNPKPRNKVPTSITHLSMEITLSEIESADELQLRLTTSQNKLQRKYKSCIIYMAAILDMNVPKKATCSSTYAQSFPITENKKEAEKKHTKL